ncbi:MAG: hypothetical protein M0R17_02740 [Candidatus Omnitrophica bacterium]|jgi:Zn finger protein HypA/HybF involved in hydrogenase expression|nr:hypothetical protein [Candidatus Omnitrophota bacterium]
MYIPVKEGSKFLYFCPHCGYERTELLDHPMYSWSCPKCNSYNYEVIECSQIEKPNV